MKKTKRFLALALVLVMALACSLSASAASYKRVSGSGYVTVETDKAPWYAFFCSPQITVKNVGKTTAHIQIYNEQGRCIKEVTALKAGKSHTFSLSKNQTFEVAYTGHYSVGPYSNLEISAKRYIKNIW